MQPPNSDGNKKKVLDFLRHFVFKEHWEEAKKHVEHLEKQHQIWQGNDAGQIFRRVMNRCNGALDVYGPEGFLNKCYVVFSMNQGCDRAHQDSQLQQYLPKNTLMESLVKGVFMSSMQWVIPEIFDLLIESLKGYHERELAGTYEFIPKYYCEHVSADLAGFCSKQNMNQLNRSNVQNLMLHQKEAVEWRKEPLIAFSKFSELFNKDHDQKLLSELQQYLFKISLCRSEEGTHLFSAYCLFRDMKGHVLSIIQKHSYTFLPFSASKKILRTRFPVEPLAIRLIKCRDDTVLFVKDVEDAVKRALRNKREIEGIPKGLLNVETEAEKNNGIYFVMSHSDYLNILQKLPLSSEDIILVNTAALESASLTIPIYSPYGTECKPAVNVFSELLNMLTIVLRVWENIQPDQLPQLEKNIEEVCAMFMDRSKPQYFIECGRVERLSEQLRQSVRSLVGNTPFPPKALPFFDFPIAKLNLNLIRTGADSLLLSRFYPEISYHFRLLYAKRSNFTSKTCISQLELISLLQGCLALSIIDKIPWIGEFICNQKRCLAFGLSKCPCSQANCLLAENRSSYTSAVVTNENDYTMKFVYFPEQKYCFPSLMKKTEKLHLVSNYMAQAFVTNSVLKQMEPEYRKRLVDWQLPSFQLNWKNSKCATFYMTSAEMVHLSEDVVRKFNIRYKSVQNEEIKRKLRNVGAASEYLFSEICFPIYDECLTFSLECLRDVSSFEKYIPNRIVYLTLTPRQVPEAAEMELLAESGEFLSALKSKMTQNEFAETRKSWDSFNRLMVDWQTDDDGFPLMRADVIASCLDGFTVDPGKFHFVPDIDCVFRYLTQQVSRVITEVFAKEKQASAERRGEGNDNEYNPDAMTGIIEAVQKMQSELTRTKEELCGANEKLSRYEKAKSEEILALEEKMEEAARNFQKMSKKREEDFEGLQNSLISSYNESLEAKDRKLKELEESMKNTSVEHDQEKNKMNIALKSKDAEIEKLKKENSSVLKLNQQISKLETKINQLNLEKDNQINNLKINHQNLYQSICSDLAECTEEKELLERQLAEAAVRIADLEEQSAGRSDQHARDSISVQRIDQLTGENQCLQSKLRLEKIKHDAVQRQNADLLKHIEEIETLLANRTAAPSLPVRTTVPPLLPLPLEGPSTSGSSPCPSSPVPESSAPVTSQITRKQVSTLECGICFNEMKKNSRLTKCETCKNQWHSACINKWTSTNPTCPICRRSFPNSRQFPPLRRN